MSPLHGAAPSVDRQTHGAGRVARKVRYKDTRIPRTRYTAMLVLSILLLLYSVGSLGCDWFYVDN